MHLGLIVVVIVMALGLRWSWRTGQGSWLRRWQAAWVAFCLPPLLILSGAIAILQMGHHGTMMGLAVSPVGCHISQGLVGMAIVAVIYSLIKVLWLQGRLSSYPQVKLPTGETAHLLETDLPVAAQVGLWQSSLLVSRGWLNTLTAPEQRAILCHEQAHARYQDPLCFLALGIVRRFSGWLPRTEALWQELLLLREIRADRWAAQQTEPLLVAELLVKLSRQKVMMRGAIDPIAGVGFNHIATLYALEQRVEALLEATDDLASEPTNRHLFWLTLAIVPLLAISLHR